MEVETFQQQALEVQWPDENFDPSAEPQDGEAFLTKVVYERMHCPAVMVKSVQDIQMKSTPTPNVSAADELIDSSPEELQPSEEWKNAQLNDFTQLREKVLKQRSKMKISGDPIAKYLQKIKKANESENEEDIWKALCTEHDPHLSLILPISQRSLEKLLEFEVEWLEECASQENAETFAIERWLGLWIYSTLACLQMPIEPDVHSSLREIAKICINIRNRLQPTDVQKVAPINLLILLIAKYFRQLDLCRFI